MVVLRVSGKRTLAQLDAFDWNVGVALGSTTATILLSIDVTGSEGAVAPAVFAGLQQLVTRVTSWLPGGRSVVTSTPTLLLEDGHPLDDTMHRQRITVSEQRQAVRVTGSGDLSAVAAVIILESDGSLSVISRSQAGNRPARADVEDPA